jgi:hypothetical protein
MKKLVSHSALFVALLLTPMAAFGLNTKFNHRAGNSIHETRYERNCLSTLKLEVMGGRATQAYDSNKNTVNLLDLYGLNKVGALGQGEIGNPGSSLYNFDLANLITLGGAAVPGGLGLKYAGKLTHFEANLYWAQNFCDGWFVEFNLPVKKIEVKDVVATDGTTTAGLASLAAGGTVVWERVKANLTETLTAYNLSDAATSKSGIGDIWLGAGWTYNNDEIENLDFLDTTIRFGLSVPSSSKRDENKAFEIALGHDNHTALGASFDLALGFYDWVTFGAHVGGLFFFKKTQELRMHTATGQNGFFKLQKGNAERDMGNMWDAGAFLKADHIFKGVSLAFGYNYVDKGDDTLTPENLTRFSSAAANEDPMLEGWSSHNITVALEYDMAEEGRKFNPNFSVFYSRPLKGKYIYKTDVGGGSVGVNVTWDY